MRDLARRIGKLEQQQPEGVMLHTIFVHFVDATDAEPRYACRQHDGLSLERQAGEALAAFEERAAEHFRSDRAVEIILMDGAP
jgi:hypothetical protein